MTTNYEKLILIANNGIKAVKSHFTAGSTNKQADRDRLRDHYTSYKFEKLKDTTKIDVEHQLKSGILYLNIQSPYPRGEKYYYSVDDHRDKEYGYELHYKYLDHNNNIREVKKNLGLFYNSLVIRYLNNARCYTQEASNQLITYLNSCDEEKRKEFLLELYREDPDNPALSKHFFGEDDGGLNYRFLYRLEIESEFMPHLSQKDVETWNDYAIRASIAQASKVGNCGNKTIWLLYYLAKQGFLKDSLPSLNLELIKLKEIDHILMKLSCKKDDASSEVISILCDPWLEEVFTDDIDSFECFDALLKKIKFASNPFRLPTDSAYGAEDRYAAEFNRREFPVAWNNKYYHLWNEEDLSFELLKKHADDFVRLVNMRYSMVLSYNSGLYQSAYAALPHFRDYLDNKYAIPLTWMRDFNSKIYMDWDQWKSEYEANPNHKQKIAKGYGPGALIKLPQL